MIITQRCAYCAPSLIDTARRYASLAYNWLYLKAVAFSYNVARFM